MLETEKDIKLILIKLNKYIIKVSQNVIVYSKSKNEYELEIADNTPIYNFNKNNIIME